MCTVTCDGSCRASSGTGVAAAVTFVAQGVWWAATRIVAPAAVASLLFLAGVAVTPAGRRDRGLSNATWLRSGQKVGKTRLGVHWYAWPGWQRSLTRLIAVGVAAAGVAAPWTLLVVSAVVAALAVAAAVARHRSKPTTTPRRVRAVVGNAHPVVEQAAGPSVEWDYDADAGKVRVG